MGVGNRITSRFRRADPAVALLVAAAAFAGVVARAAPASAFAQSGSLSALASPFECVGEELEPKAVCGTSVHAGLSNIFQSQISPDGRNVYSVATSGDLIEYSRNQANGALTVIGCIAPAGGSQCAPENESAVPAIEHPTALAISPATGADVYVAESGGVLELERNAESGLLSTLKGEKGETACVESGASGECEQKNALGLGQPYGVVVSPDEKTVYVTSVSGEAIAELERNTEAGGLSGQLTPIAGHECIGGSDERLSRRSQGNGRTDRDGREPGARRKPLRRDRREQRRW